jgi:hypothetical protein
MTAATPARDVASADTQSTHRPLRWWRDHPAAKFVLVGGIAVLLLAVTLAGPLWAHWAAFGTAFAVLVAVTAGWERTVALAQTAGLVEQSADDLP